jgi:hypothetical protein
LLRDDEGPVLRHSKEDADDARQARQLLRGEDLNEHARSFGHQSQKACNKVMSTIVDKQIISPGIERYVYICRVAINQTPRKVRDDSLGFSVVPTYDDVSYLVDGLHRLKAGFRGLFRSLAIEPAHDRPTPTCLGAQSRVRHKLNSQFAPEKPAEIGSKIPKALIVDGIHPKSCRCHAPLLFTSGN